ncbi:hypothetical protein GCM10018785_14810 [Streptomyces longispororuber]|uniref:Uncharacterized protein n=1 Tax=Streptomyces longispororuber TaxID=68230 RepID=A0A918ZCY8_9ACTN|nr:hypothetical protein [Streptomyces longispororuber]GHE46121.1 hypothetical protein GCM10018785_14810 [Streptomyces longispororuber]
MPSVDDRLTKLEKEHQSFVWKLERGLAKVDAVASVTEVTAMKKEFAAVTSSFKLASFDFNLLEHLQKNLQEQRDRAAGLRPEDLKASITDTRRAVGRAFDAAHAAGRDARRALRRLEALAARASAGTPPPRQATFGNTGTFTETAAQINRLEARINSLIRALG